MPLAAAHDYPLWINVCIFLAAAAAVWAAGTKLTVYLDGIAGRTGVDTAFAGMLLLGGITSLPEVANCITSGLIGNPALAVNNLLGSAAINIVLLAIGDAVVGREALTSMAARPSTLMLAASCMIVLTLVAASIATGDMALAGIGAWSLALFVVSVGAFWLCSGYDRRSPWGLKKDEPERAGERPTKDIVRYSERSLASLIVSAAVAGAIIFGAGYALAQIGDALAVQTALGTGMVGFALIGFSTSTPELSTVVAALRIRRPEMAIGNILGTNFINLALILLVDGVARGEPVIDRLGAFEIVSALLGATLIGIFMIGMLERRDPTILRMGYDSAAILMLFVGGLALLGSLS
jgi:cation:H+ antiporter